MPKRTNFTCRDFFRYGALIYILLLSAVHAEDARASSRKAIVIGNAAYTDVEPLKNTISDAGAYSEVLKDLGFEVTLRHDLNRMDFDLEFADFLDRVQPGDTVVFVFSGHGWSDGQTNFILPTDIRPFSSESRVKAMSTPLQNGVNGVVDQLRAAGATTQIAIIDACRNNIFEKPGAKSIGMTRGLAIERAPQGAFLIFSAGTGEQSLDGLPDDPSHQRLSVFTRHFLPKLRQGMYLEDAINEAQLETSIAARSAGGHSQNPAYYDQVNGKLCLSATCGAPKPAPSVSVSTSQPDTAPAVQTNPCEEARTVWADVSASADIDTLQAFQDAYGDCKIYASLARSKISQLNAQMQELARADDDTTSMSAGASLAQDVENRRNHPWLLIFGSFGRDGYEDATALAANLRRHGVASDVINSDDYPKLTNGLSVVVWRFASKSEAMSQLRFARGLVSDAYVKRAH